MPDYRRWHQPGGTYFFTLVTYDRRPLFENSAARGLFGGILREVAEERPFETFSIVLLPDHLHCIWLLPRDDADYSNRWNTIKGRFTSRWMTQGGTEAPTTRSQLQRRARGVWQPRFWEHLVRDVDELEAFCDYIHYNPVKHGHAHRPADWPWSSFHRFVRIGHYPPDWGASEPSHIRALAWE